MISYQADEAVRVGALQLVLREYETTPVPINLLFDASRRLPLKLRAFLDFATPRMREKLLAVQ